MARRFGALNSTTLYRNRRLQPQQHLQPQFQVVDVP